MRNDTNAQAEKAVVKEVQFGQIDVEGLFQIMTHGGSAASASWRRRRSRWTRTMCSSPRATPTTPPTTSPRAPTPAKDHQASWAENPRVQHAWHILFTLARIRKLFEKYKLQPEIDYNVNRKVWPDGKKVYDPKRNCRHHC